MSYNPKNKRPIISDTSPFLSTYSPKPRVSISFPENSPFTKQEFRDECDINLIMNRYQSTGELPPLNEVAPQYLDLSAGIDFQQSMQFVAGAQSLFNDLPSSIRNRFQNDPGLFLEFTSNPDNYHEMHKMGLLKPEVSLRIPEQPPLNVSPPQGESGANNTILQSSTPAP